ncbi:hypothetical protein [Baia soyae]|uniref:hypothetical protein n=1 Tax=Baia soyae TaxID=1544746 RepID=UPI001050A6EC|nr:hypothetical protein [Baia soyae]
MKPCADVKRPLRQLATGASKTRIRSNMLLASSLRQPPPLCKWRSKAHSPPKLLPIDFVDSPFE